MKINKIKTITCHEVYNYGASLQEMALLKYLNNNGYEAETISYKPEYLSYHNKILSCANPKWNKFFLTKVLYIVLKLPSKLMDLKRKRNFNKFSNKFISSTHTVYKTNDELKQCVPECDAFICGSDQVWNPIFENGKDPSFYLDFVPDEIKKISYAPSFAVDSIPESLVGFIKQNLTRFDSISVRETSGRKILNSLEIKDVEQVLDPVFLLDQKYWLKFVKPNLDGRYIFIYDFDSNPAIQVVAENLKIKFGYKIITINKNITYADKNFYLLGPDDFVNLIGNAELVLTTSFHALAFSLIFKKSFGVFNRNIAINTRMRDLLQLLNLTSNLFINEDNPAKDNFNITYETVTPLLEEHIVRSKQFLIKALS